MNKQIIAAGEQADLAAIALAALVNESKLIDLLNRLLDAAQDEPEPQRFPWPFGMKS